MEENVKNLWLSKIKSGKVAVIESHYAPNNTNCIWLKDNTMYVYANSGWAELSSSGEDTPAEDPKYITTPLEFKNTRFVNIDDTSFLVADAAVSEQNTALHSGSILKIESEEHPENFLSLYGTIFAEDNPEAAEEVTEVLSAIYPNSTINFISRISNHGNYTSVIIADIDGERKAISLTIMPSSEEDESLKISVNYTAPVGLINPISVDQYPITFKPFVIYKMDAREDLQDESSQLGTEFYVGWYADNLDGDAFYKIQFKNDLGVFIPRWNASKNNELSGVAAINGFINKVFNLFPYNYWQEESIKEEMQISNILPDPESLTFEEVFGENIEVSLMLSSKYKGKTLAVNKENSRWVPGTGLTDTQLLMTYFECTEEELENKEIIVDLYYDSGMH